MRMRLMLLGGGNVLGQALIQQGAEEDIGFLAPKPPESGWDAASLTQLLDETRPDALINLAYYFDWFQAETVTPARFNEQQRAVERLAELCKHHEIMLIQPSSYRVFDGSRATAYSEKDEPAPLGLHGQAMRYLEQSVRATCPRHVLLRFGWLLDGTPEGLLGRFLSRAERDEALYLADDRRGNPTPIDDAARVILAVLKQLDCMTPLWGTYHYGGHEATTSLALGQAALSEARNFRSSLVEEITPQAHVARPDASEEPQHAVLACKKILHTFGIKPRAWRAGLPNLLDYYYRHV
ncbi:MULTISPECIES: sugar nucleotide-binding protein [Pseudomonas]|uniref:sugar nucleotide-binding protein n=1 Tax=Pseudomonas TaxID=286 RepID=UPI000854EDF7|nr:MULTISPECIES: sugar nucleotide-binding protein [Pseudomonas]MBQ54697.1 dTDP-4-dehydrorhamnose reductase [Pseudomonadaceae bacterium]HCP53989.1 dTDP-4-dehydrorhamnose reductase [Pseudomonas sp.]NRH27103.1 sugar nucleotide-binding protein [Pseudomonas sp. MS19]OEO23639.1 dTDP-4-dehydrorhamnose reductase [Pseudomonas sp. J237]SFU15191.1 dTDP-4-dehydrorhamnose reductase [Pseudomonas marincola]